MHKGALFLAFLLAACDQEEPPALVCSLGELTGTWRVTYDEKNGNCGPIPAETVASDAAKPPKPSEDPCTRRLHRVSSDRCRFDFDFTCPTTDGAGAQRWVGVTKQTAEDRLESDVTVELDHPELGVCRSTYTATWTRL